MGRIRWSRHREMLAKNLIQMVGTERATLSRSEYEALRIAGETSAPLPSYQTILSLAPDSQSFGEAINTLSGDVIQLRPTASARTNDPAMMRWTSEKIIDVMCRWFQKIEDHERNQPSAYNRWREEEGVDHVPSSSTIYARFGAWEAAVKAAEQHCG